MSMTADVSDDVSSVVKVRLTMKLRMRLRLRKEMRMQMTMRMDLIYTALVPLRGVVGVRRIPMQVAARHTRKAKEDANGSEAANMPQSGNSAFAGTVCYQLLLLAPRSPLALASLASPMLAISPMPLCGI